MHVLLFLKFQSHTDRLRQWVTMGVALLVLGIVLHFSHGINRYKKKSMLRMSQEVFIIFRLKFRLTSKLLVYIYTSSPSSFLDRSDPAQQAALHVQLHLRHCRRRWGRLLSALLLGRRCRVSSSTTPHVSYVCLDKAQDCVCACLLACRRSTS